MRNKALFTRLIAWSITVLMALPPAALAQQPAQQPAPQTKQQSPAAPVFKQEEIEQLVAPIALYPDSLVSQILMASTYPLEIVQADRWIKQNKDLKGDALAKALETQTWDPSVRSLVNFPQVLAMMSEKLDVTQKIGDAFLAQQKDVLAAIQNLRAKAQAEGNLKTTKEQKVVVEQAAPQTTIIKIEPANPQVVYVPTYNPVVVYGAWPYPAYPPYPYYPPGYVATAAFSFAAGVAIGSAWGYAWGSPDYHGGNVKVNYNQNVNINNNINRQAYVNQQPAGQGNWQHNPANRKGVPYNGQSVQQRYNQATPSQQVNARQAYRGHTGSALTPQEQQQAQQRAQQAQQQQGGQQAQQARQQQTAQQGQQREQQAQSTQARGGEQARASEGAGNRGGADGGASGSRGGAFEGISGGGSSARSASQRGSSSRGGGDRSGGGRSGGGRR